MPDPAERLPLEIFRQCIRLCYEEPPLRASEDQEEQMDAVITYNQTVTAAQLVSRRWAAATSVLRGTHVYWERTIDELKSQSPLEAIEVLVLERDSRSAVDVLPPSMHRLHTLMITGYRPQLPVVHCRVTRFACTTSSFSSALTCIPDGVQQLAIDLPDFDDVESYASMVNRNRLVFPNIAALSLKLSETMVDPGSNDALTAFPNLQRLQLIGLYPYEIEALVARPSDTPQWTNLKTLELIEICRDNGRTTSLALPDSMQTLTINGMQEPLLVLGLLNNSITALPSSSQLRRLTLLRLLERRDAQALRQPVGALKARCERRGIVCTSSLDCASTRRPR